MCSVYFLLCGFEVVTGGTVDARNRQTLLSAGNENLGDISCGFEVMDLCDFFHCSIRIQK